MIIVLALVGTGLGLGLTSSKVDDGSSSNGSLPIDNATYEESFRNYDDLPEPSETVLGSYKSAAIAIDGEPCAEIAR